MVTFFQINGHLCKKFAMYINFQKNEGKRAPYSCRRGFQGFSFGCEGGAGWKGVPRKQNLKNQKHFDCDNYKSTKILNMEIIQTD